MSRTSNHNIKYNRVAQSLLFGLHGMLISLQTSHAVHVGIRISIQVLYQRVNVLWTPSTEMHPGWRFSLVIKRFNLSYRTYRQGCCAYIFFLEFFWSRYGYVHNLYNTYNMYVLHIL